MFNVRYDPYNNHPKLRVYLVSKTFVMISFNISSKVFYNVANCDITSCEICY
jgi:hypothetical protein